ncbi:MAG: hypothetical protein QQN63_06760, partial [Nitrosopumilus sp.]
ADAQVDIGKKQVFNSKSPSDGVLPDKKLRSLPDDIQMLRLRIETNAALELDDPERLKVAAELLEDSKKMKQKYIDQKKALAISREKKLEGVKTIGSVDRAARKLDPEADPTTIWNKRSVNPNDNNMLTRTPSLWGMGDDNPGRFFLADDIKFIDKQMGHGKGDVNKFLNQLAQWGGSAAGKVRILQTALDFAFPLINGPLLFGYDSWRFGAGLINIPARTLNVIPGVNIKKAGDLSALSPLHPFFKAAAGLKIAPGAKSSSIFGESMWQAGAAFRSPARRAKYWVREAKLYEEQFKAWTKFARVSGLPHELGEFGFWENIEKATVGKIPIVGKHVKGFQRFQDSFTAYLNAGSWEYFKSLYHIAANDTSQLQSLGDLSRNLIGMHAGAELGLSKGQLSSERIAFYAPSFTRASFAVMGQAFNEALSIGTTVGTLGKAGKKGSFGGKRSLESLTGLFASMSLFVSAYTFAQAYKDNDYSLDGLEWNRLSKNLKDFWTPGVNFWGIKDISSGSYTGLGGAARSNTQLIFRLIDRGFEGTTWDWKNAKLPDFSVHPEKFLPNPWGGYDGPPHTEVRNAAIKFGLAQKDWTEEERDEYTAAIMENFRDEQNDGDFWRHPLVKWYRGKSGVISSMAWDLASGHDFLGFKVDRTNIPRLGINLIPFYLQEAFENRRANSLTDIAAVMGEEFLGITHIPQSSFENYQRVFAEEFNGTREHLFKKDSQNNSINFNLIEDFKTNKEDHPKTVEAWDQYKDQVQDKGGDFADWDAGKLEIFQRRDAEINDIVADFDWNSPDSWELIKPLISSKYSEANARKNDLAEEIFGEEAQGVIEFYEGIPLSDLTPQSVLQFASDPSNFVDTLTHKIDYDKRTSVISEAVDLLPPAERAAWLEKQFSDIGRMDTKRFENGDYDATNEFFERKAKANDLVGEWLNAPKYKNTTVKESEQIKLLIDVVGQAADLLQIQTGKSFSKKKILLVLNNILPQSKVLQYALIDQYTHLRSSIISTKKFDLMMENPDLVLFHSFTITGFSLSEEQKEAWRLANPDGSNGWRPRTKVVRNLLETEGDREGYRRDFGPDLDEEEGVDKSFGFPTEPSWYQKQLASINPF